MNKINTITKEIFRIANVLENPEKLTPHELKCTLKDLESKMRKYMKYDGCRMPVECTCVDIEHHDFQDSVEQTLYQLEEIEKLNRAYGLEQIADLYNYIKEIHVVISPHAAHVQKLYE
jgi:hypothetical protein